MKTIDGKVNYFTHICKLHNMFITLIEYFIINKK